MTEDSNGSVIISFSKQNNEFEYTFQNKGGQLVLKK
jgi:hypothetical protein